ncbi:hypothetical protein [Lysobacter sp. HA35]
MKRAKPAPVAAQSWVDELDDRLLSTRDAARFLGYTGPHMRKLRSANEGPTWLVMPNGFSIRYRLGDLKQWVGLSRGAA